LKKDKSSDTQTRSSLVELNHIQANVEASEVKRGLKSRHITMIALGGTIGTGLFIGIANPLENAGPVNALTAYLFMGSLVYSVMQSLGEMTTFIPVTSSFTVFSKRFLSPALGITNGYMYCYSSSICFAVELSVASQIIQYWTDAVPQAVWIAIFFVILTGANFFPVKVYGEIEFWISSIKVIAILGFMIYSLIMVCGAGVTGPVGFRYWINPGPWGPGYIFEGTATGRFLGWVASLVGAAFTYLGTELTGVSAGESKNPRKTIPKAINSVFWRILIFYIASLFFVGLLVPSNDPLLGSVSPFIIAIENSGTKVLPHIFNAAILMTVLSAGNSCVYAGSRILYSLACNKSAPKWFTYTTRQGVPYYSVMATAAFGLLAFMSVSEGALNVFNWLSNIVAVAGLFAWLLISLSHIRFMQALKFRGISRDKLPFKAKFMPYSAYYASICISVIIIINGFKAFIGGFNVSSFFAAYISVIVFVGVWIIFQLFFRGSLFLRVEDIDIDTDRKESDDTVWEEEVPKNIWEKFWAILA
jgi:amino acid transporter